MRSKNRKTIVIIGEEGSEHWVTWLWEGVGGLSVACLMYAPPPRRQTRRRRDAAPQCRYRAFGTIPLAARTPSPFTATRNSENTAPYLQAYVA